MDYIFCAVTDAEGTALLSDRLFTSLCSMKLLFHVMSKVKAEMKLHNKIKHPLGFVGQSWLIAAD